VRDLQPGDEFLTQDGDPTFVDRIESRGRMRVFNLEIEDFHTYFVSCQGIWVHNQKDVKIGASQLRRVEGEAIVSKPEW
jgi:hypothetical protein